MKEKILKGKVTKRLLSVVLALAMILTLMPQNSMTVYAEGESSSESSIGLKYAFIPMFTDGKVKVVNTENHQEVKTISVGMQPNSAAVTSDGKYCLVTNRQSGSVSVIDVATFSVIKTITGIPNAEGIGFSDDNTCAYVASYGIYKIEIGGTWNKQLTNFKNKVNLLVVAGNKIYTMNENDEKLYVVDPENDFSFDTKTIKKSFGLLTAVDGKSVYLGQHNNSNSQNVIQKVDTASGEITDIQLSKNVVQPVFDFSEDGKYLYIVDFNAQIIKYDLENGNEEQYTALQGYDACYSCGITLDQKYLYILSYNQSKLVVVDTSSLEKVTEIDVKKPFLVGSFMATGRTVRLYKEKYSHTHAWNYEVERNEISVYCSSTESSENCAANGSSSAKTLTLSAPSDLTYNGQKKAATVTGQEEFVELTGATVGDINYEGVGETGYTKQTTAPTDVGTYNATVTVTAANGTPYTATKQFTIAKANATCSVTGKNNLTYNGKEQDLVTSTKNGCTIYYRVGENGEWSTTVPKAKNAGTYDIYYYGLADENHNSVGSAAAPKGPVSVTIAKKPLNAEMITIAPASKVFDDEPTRPEVTVSDMVDSTQCITVDDYEISGADVQEEVGDYTITVTAKEEGNYSGSAQKIWRITGASFGENDIAVTSCEADYDGKAHGINIELSGAAEGAKITYSETESGTYTATKPAYKNVKTTDGGAYTVYYKVNKRGYYEEKGSSTVKINPKEVGIEWTHTDDLVYNAAEQKPTATATGLLEGDECNVTVTGGQTNSNKKDGNESYTATADSLDNANYKLPATKPTAEFTIAQKEISVNWTNTTLTYNREVQKPTANLEGVCSGDTCDIAVEGGQTDAGDSYQATATLHNDNYKIADGQSVTYTIKPKPIAEDMVALDSENHLYIYAGTPITPSVTVKDGAVVLVSGEDQEYVLSGTTSASDFGDYELQVAGRGNYTGEVKVAWKIADSLAPTGTISIAEDSWTEFWNGVTFGRFYNQTQIVTITAEDPAGEGGAAASGIDKIYYYKSPAILTYDKVAALAEGIWTEYKDSITVDSDDKLVIYAKITDKSGNVTYISTEGLVLDKTAPDITGVTDGQKYCGEKTITVKDANLDKVTINGAEVTLVDDTYPLSATEETGKEFSIVATDKAGNSTTVTVTICKGHIWPDDWTVLKAATETKDGKEEMKCSNGCGHKKIRVIPALGSPEDLYGNLEKDAEVALGAPIHEATLNTSKETLVNSMFGGSLSDPDARVWIEIDAVDESSISDSDKGNMIQKAEEELGENPTLTYFDASLYQKLNNIQSKISNPGCNISISIVIPDTLLNHDSLMVRDYKIIRLHGGSVQTISGTFDESTKEFTFETDQFSTYAIAFKDKPKYSGGNSGSGGGGSYNPVTGITITSEKATLTKAGETLQLTVNVSPGNASNKKVTWKSDNEAVATVDSNGKVTAVGNGTATITATTESGNKSVTCVITVNITPEETADPSVPADTDEPGTTKPEKVTSDFGALKAKSVKQTSTTVTLSWTKQSDADGYLVYGSRCNSNGKKYTKKLLKTIKGNRTLTWTQKNLDKATYYKYQVKAYKIVNGKKVIIANSVDVHVATKGGKYCVASAVEVTKLAGKKAGKDLKLSLTKGKTAQITAGETPAEKNKTIKHHRELCYESSNRKVATVTKSGKIKAVGKGTCKIWVYAQNGVYQKVKVTVK